MILGRLRATKGFTYGDAQESVFKEVINNFYFNRNIKNVLKIIIFKFMIIFLRTTEVELSEVTSRIITMRIGAPSTRLTFCPLIAAENIFLFSHFLSGNQEDTPGSYPGFSCKY